MAFRSSGHLDDFSNCSTTSIGSNHAEGDNNDTTDSAIGTGAKTLVYRKDSDAGLTFDTASGNSSPRALIPLTRSSKASMAALNPLGAPPAWYIFATLSGIFSTVSKDCCQVLIESSPIPKCRRRIWETIIDGIRARSSLVLTSQTTLSRILPS